MKTFIHPLQCIICHENVVKACCCSTCSKISCQQCIDSWMEASGAKECPFCRTDFKYIKILWADDFAREVDKLAMNSGELEAKLASLTLEKEEATKQLEEMEDRLLAARNKQTLLQCEIEGLKNKIPPEIQQPANECLQTAVEKLLEKFEMEKISCGNVSKAPRNSILREVEKSAMQIAQYMRLLQLFSEDNRDEWIRDRAVAYFNNLQRRMTLCEKELQERKILRRFD